MNRLFGKGKPKEPPPNINDCIAGVSLIVSVCPKSAVILANIQQPLLLNFVSDTEKQIYNKPPYIWGPYGF
jgi:hypothetical protein